MIVGYARTSATDQSAGLAAQKRDLTAAGAERIFGEQVSSTAKRVKLAKCLTFMREGRTAVHRSGSVEARHWLGGGCAQPDQQLMLTILAGVATVATM